MVHQGTITYIFRYFIIWKWDVSFLPLDVIYEPSAIWLQGQVVRWAIRRKRSDCVGVSCRLLRSGRLSCYCTDTGSIYVSSSTSKTTMIYKLLVYDGWGSCQQLWWGGGEIGGTVKYFGGFMGWGLQHFESAQRGGGGVLNYFELFYLKYACQYYGITVQWGKGARKCFTRFGVGCENVPYVWGGMNIVL